MRRAVELYERAVDSENYAPLFNLATIYEEGMDVPQNLERALVLYEIAGSRGDNIAANRADKLREAMKIK